MPTDHENDERLRKLKEQEEAEQQAQDEQPDDAFAAPADFD